jgi:hypothetical protein
MLHLISLPIFPWRKLKIKAPLQPPRDKAGKQRSKIYELTGRQGNFDQNHISQ